MLPLISFLSRFLVAVDTFFSKIAPKFRRGSNTRRTKTEVRGSVRKLSAGRWGFWVCCLAVAGSCRRHDFSRRSSAGVRIPEDRRRKSAEALGSPAQAPRTPEAARGDAEPTARQMRARRPATPPPNGGRGGGTESQGRRGGGENGIRSPAGEDGRPAQREAKKKC